MTYSLVACDLDRGEWGVAVQSRFLAVGAVVPAAAARVGAIATQSYANPAYRGDGLRLLREGCSAPEVVQRLVGADVDRDVRQVGVVDGRGLAASYTGAACLEWAGDRSGPGYAAQGNVLVSAATVDALAECFEGTGGEPLAARLLAALRAAQDSGGDRRGQQSAALLVMRPGGGYGGLDDVAVDLRVDDHTAPVEELARLLALHQLYFGETPQDEWLDVDEELAEELRSRLARLGYASGDLAADLWSWAGVENLEERVSGWARIDPVVLGELRAR